MSQDLAVQFFGGGGPEVMKLTQVERVAPKAGEVSIAVTAIGVNFIDVLQRRFSPEGENPMSLGRECVGIVEEIGPGVEGVGVGDRVGVVTAGTGAYSTRWCVAADKLIPLPPSLSDEDAASLLFKGLTAQYLVERTYRVSSDTVMLVQAAAGGVGSILCAWGRGLGAQVIGVAGGPERCQFALQSGAAHAIDHQVDQIATRVAEITHGQKAHVAYDSVGLETFQGSMDSLRKFGLLVIYGAASGATPPIDPETLNAKGGLYLTRPSIFTHNGTRGDLIDNASSLFTAIEKGWVRPSIGARFALQDVGEAHRALESREIQGTIVLIP
jgi:NADPH:quinone reductase